MKHIYLTGIKPTGTPHLGNYIGTIKPALALADLPNTQAYYFIADYHSLTINLEPKLLRQYVYEVAATWLSLGLDPDKVHFYCQSDLPEIMELSWILACYTAKGLMNRAHAYKALVAENEASQKSDVDININAGIYTYPILMAADILVFDVDVVPVGQDQVQHIEIARDIAVRFNTHYGKSLLKLPAASIAKNAAIIPGLDGRKMSKSYHNTIPIFADPVQLKKLVMRIITDSTLPHEPKDPNTSTIFQLYTHFASETEIAEFKEAYQTGIGWGDAKKELLRVLEERLQEPRDKYNALMADISKIDRILKDGADRIRPLAQQKIKQIREEIGID